MYAMIRVGIISRLKSLIKEKEALYKSKLYSFEKEYDSSMPDEIVEEKQNELLQLDASIVALKEFLITL